MVVCFQHLTRYSGPLKREDDVVKLLTEISLSHKSLVPQNLQAIQKENALLATLCSVMSLQKCVKICKYILIALGV